jgi:hypothetical protein
MVTQPGIFLPFSCLNHFIQIHDPIEVPYVLRSFV